MATGVGPANWQQGNQALPRDPQTESFSVSNVVCLENLLCVSVIKLVTNLLRFAAHDISWRVVDERESKVNEFRQIPIYSVHLDY